MTTTTPDSTVSGPGTVEQIALPPAARRLTTLPHVDYTDAFLVAFAPGAEPTPERWARAVIEGAPRRVRIQLLCSWTALGLKLGSPWSERRVLGWEVRRDSRDALLLGADSRIGLPGELLFKREPGAMLFATFTRQSNPAARALWSATIDRHQRVVRSLLRHASVRLAVST